MILLCLGVEADSGELDGGVNEELVAKLKIRKNSVGQGGKASDNCEGIWATAASLHVGLTDWH